jgi:anthranilate synthase component 1
VITELEFQSLAAQGHNRIPLISEAFADLETPLSLYLKLAGGQPLSFLLESVVGGERFGRYSFIGLPARTLLRCSGTRSEVVTEGEVVETADGNPLDFVAAYRQRFRPALRPGLPRFCGGLAGYFGYETVRAIEPRLARTRKSGGLGTPDILLLQTEELAVIDNLSGRLYLIVWADPGQPESYFRAKRRLAELADRLRFSVAAPQVRRGPSYAVERELPRAQFEAAVRRAKEYIAAGDCMQVVIGQRLRKRYTVRCDRSTQAPTCTTTTWGGFTSSAPAPRSWCGRRTRPTAPRSRSARWPARARAARRPSRTRGWRPSCRPTRRSAPST